MPPKRTVSDRSDKDMSEGDREFKKQKTLPRRGTIQMVIEGFLDLLSPATPEAFKEFNALEKKEKRRGVTPIDIVWLGMTLNRLLEVTDVETLDAKLNKLGSYLENKQGLYDDYIDGAASKGKKVQRWVTDTLLPVTERIEAARERLPDMFSHYIKAIMLSKPPPSDYAEAKNWAALQILPNPMLCMRPVKCRGPPIFLLHPVFAEYLSLSKEALPATPEARTALKVARELCNTMGNYFDGEKARRDSFLQTIHPLFSRWITTKVATSQGVKASTRTDATISVDGITMALTEIKNGKKGDAYMQASRGYEVITEELAKTNSNFLARGAPMFISCLNDEELIIAGVFKDGGQVVVEPLAYSLLYPDSRADGRTMQLAQNLFALYSRFGTIAREIKSQESPPLGALGCPRVFSEVRNRATDQNERLEFIRPRKDLWETRDGTIDYLNFIYDATLGGTKVLAKVVLRSYGREVHAHLATRHMAPQLLGYSNVQGIATVVVMELLEDGWTTLFDYRENKHRNGITEGPKTRLLKRLEDILGALCDLGMVHGDFRMANIMLKPGEEEKAVLIDFDLAGEAEREKYPVTRSDGFGYPGKPGRPIGAGDDRRFYETWKNEM